MIKDVFKFQFWNMHMCQICELGDKALRGKTIVLKRLMIRKIGIFKQSACYLEFCCIDVSRRLIDQSVEASFDLLDGSVFQ